MVAATAGFTASSKFTSIGPSPTGVGAPPPPTMAGPAPPPPARGPTPPPPMGAPPPPEAGASPARRIREDRPHRQVVAPLEVARARIGHRSAITCGDHDISTGVGENSYNVGRELRPASNHVGDGNLVVDIR